MKPEKSAQRFGFILGMLMLCTAPACSAQDNKALRKQHAKIIRQFPDVQHIDSAALSKIKDSSVIIFDVREKPEYDISHINGAVHVPPNISTQTFLEQYGANINGKTVVFYCSVGQRSSILAQKVQMQLKQGDVKTIYNLEGGLFKWHNDARILTDKQGQTTRAIHPYNRFWGRMINDTSKHSYTP